MAIVLKHLRYYQHEGKPKEWKLDGLTLRHVNLVVGKNATGKSRTLNVIANLAKAFVKETQYQTTNAGYDLVFDSNGEMLHYELNVIAGKVRLEKLHVNNKPVLLRGPKGRSKIMLDQFGKWMEFKPPQNELAAVLRRDEFQHPFLEPLHIWARGVRHYQFGSSLIQHVFYLPSKERLTVADEINQNQLLVVFREAIRDIGKEKFAAAVIEDMKELKYDLEEINLIQPLTRKFALPRVVADPQALGIKEQGIDGEIDQEEMSQGMFRVLALLIQVNYSQFVGRANCILIDDIGEGLDFERSTLLIDLLQKKAQRSKFQLVMATNDQFVMNHVPLTEWSVLQRKGPRVVVRNYENSKKDFEDFRFVGMSNFSFFEMDFLNNPPLQDSPTDE